jgi:hypothetical protein
MQKIIIALGLVIIVIGGGFFLLNQEANQEEKDTSEEISKESSGDVEIDDEWEKDFEIAFDDLEKAFDCMEKAGVDIAPLMGTYFECVFENCMDIAMTDEESDACTEDCIAPIESKLEIEFSKLQGNMVFEKCMENI